MIFMIDHLDHSLESHLKNASVSLKEFILKSSMFEFIEFISQHFGWNLHGVMMEIHTFAS